VELSQYVLEALRRDEEFVLYRGKPSHQIFPLLRDSVSSSKLRLRVTLLRTFSVALERFAMPPIHVRF
jgi:hypothetical protein